MSGSFSRYTLIGLVNTALHWVVYGLVLWGSSSQALGNFAGFMVAASFSFFANARWNFRAEPSTLKYILFVSFMGGMSWLVGAVADHLAMMPLLTPLIFSLFSLVAGFLYTRFVIFRDISR